MNDINTFGDLKKAVRIWLNRKDASTLENIPMFINMAHKQFTRMVKLPYYEVLVSLEAIEGFEYVNIPQDFLSAKHISVNGLPYNRVDNETFMRVKSSGTQETSLGSGDTGYDYTYLTGATTQNKFFFTRVGGQLHFIPELKAGDTVEMVYQRDIPEFKDDNDEPYSLLIASDIMLYLSLRHAATFLRDNEQEQFWMQKASDAASSLQMQLDEAEWSGSATVVPQFHM
ncbi:MAG: phage adaptor protein [Bacteroidales bacterium]